MLNGVTEMELLLTCFHQSALVGLERCKPLGCLCSNEHVANQLEPSRMIHAKPLGIFVSSTVTTDFLTNVNNLASVRKSFLMRA
jgi:hypothetical protein